MAHKSRPGFSIYETRQWRKVRLAVLERDGYACQIRGPECTRLATHVDHVIPALQAPYLQYDADNLRASCAKCNYGRIDRTAVNRWTRSATRLVLVVGPPGTDLAAYCNVGDNDLLIDWVTIQRAVSAGQQTHDDGIMDDGMVNRQTDRLRSEMLVAVQRGNTGYDTVWITSSNPNAEGMFPHHRTQVVDVDRVAALANSPHMHDLIEAWYAARLGTVAPSSGRHESTWL